jgi:hypothetical protein
MSAFRFLNHAPEMEQEGYNRVSKKQNPLFISQPMSIQYRGSFFKLPTMTKWMVVASGSRYVDDIRNASEEYLSLHEALIQVISQGPPLLLRSC